MKLSEKNQELLDGLYPKGYKVKEAEKHNYHVLFVKIFPTPGQDENILSPMVQQINVKDWGIQKRLLDKGWSLASITGYNRFAIIHDPIEEAEKQKEIEETKERERVENIRIRKEKEKAALEAKKKAKAEKAKPGPKPEKVESHN